RRVHDHLAGEISACPGPILNNEWLAEPFRQPLRQKTRDDVGCGGGRKTNDQTYRARRIGLCACDAAQRRERQSARCELNESSTREFHLHVGLLQAPGGWDRL